MIDLHIHSNMSDGQYSPSELIRKAAQSRITIVSLTDHDTISGVEEAALTAEECGLKFIPGIEISVKGNKELHILGYCIDIYNENLKRMCDNFERLRHEREQRIFKFLSDKGADLTREQVENYVIHGRIGRPHFARALVEAKYVSNYREAFDRYLGTDEFSKIERPKPNPTDGIGTIREAGGIAILAHPSQLKLDDLELEDLIKSLLESGLMGIECHYSEHTSEQTSFYESLACKYNLFITGGSDFHGEDVKPNIEIGTGINHSLCFNDEKIADRLWRAAKNA